MGALLVSAKTDWTALRQDFRLPETAGNIIFHPGRKTGANLLPCLHKKDSRGTFLTLSPAPPDPAQTNAGKGESILPEVFVREV